MANAMLYHALRVIGGVAALVAVGVSAPPVTLAESGQRLVIARLSNEPHKHLHSLHAMANYLAAQLADEGIAGVDVAFAESPAQMRRMLEEKKVDLLSETAFMALEFMNDGTAKALAREWKKGVPEYHSVIIARKDSGLTALSDLVGRKFAFEDPGSTSGYLLPRIALEDAGLRLMRLPDPRNPVRDGTVGFSFAQGEINVIAWVNRGLADAGALSNLDWDEPDAAANPLKKDLQIIYRTEPVVRSLFLARSSLDGRLCERIAEILQSMHESPEGRAVLKEYFDVARYDSLEGDALKGLEAARRVWLRFRGQAE